VLGGGGGGGRTRATSEASASPLSSILRALRVSMTPMTPHASAMGGAVLAHRSSALGTGTTGAKGGTSASARSSTPYTSRGVKTSTTHGGSAASASILMP